MGHQPHMLKSVHMYAGNTWEIRLAVPPVIKLFTTWTPSGVTRKATFLSSFLVVYHFLVTCHCLLIYPQFYTCSCKYVHFDPVITLLLMLLLEEKALINKLIVIITPHQMN